MKLPGVSVVALLATLLLLSSCGGGGGSDAESPAPKAANTTFPAGSTMAKIVERGTLKVGVKFDSPPFAFKDPRSGKIDGFDIAMARYVAAAMGVKVEFVQVTTDNRVPFIRNQTVDMVFATLTITKERAAQVGFSDPYYLAQGRILVGKGSKVTGLADLGGKKVCQTVGSSYIPLLKKQVPSVEFHLANDVAQCGELLESGSVDAVVFDDVVDVGLVIQHDGFRMVGESIGEFPYGAGVRTSNEDLVEFVNTTLTEVKDDGRWQKQYKQWVGRYTKKDEQPPRLTLKQALARQ